MDKLIASAAEAVTDIGNGASLAVGGFGLCGIPSVLIGALPVDGGDLVRLVDTLTPGWADRPRRGRRAVAPGVGVDAPWTRDTTAPADRAVRFPSRIRASGYGVGYSLALIIPAFYAFYLSGLGALVPSFIAPVLLVALSGVLVALGGWLGPETRDVDMGATEQTADPNRQEKALR